MTSFLGSFLAVAFTAVALTPHLAFAQSGGTLPPPPALSPPSSPLQVTTSSPSPPPYSAPPGSTILCGFWISSGRFMNPKTGGPTGSYLYMGAGLADGNDVASQVGQDYDENSQIDALDWKL